MGKLCADYFLPNFIIKHVATEWQKVITEVDFITYGFERVNAYMLLDQIMRNLRFTSKAMCWYQIHPHIYIGKFMTNNRIRLGNSYLNHENTEVVYYTGFSVKKTTHLH